MGETGIPGVLHLRGPEAPARPLVFDSPHSGCLYPEDFEHAAPLLALRGAEDAFVDELYGAAPACGGTLLCALFPRSYIDPNRNPADLDAGLLDAPWPGPLAPGARSARGSGLIWGKYPPGLPLYDRKLTVAEVRRRIDRYHAPYHTALKAELERTHGRFGAVWHINCHSMSALSTEMSPEGPGVAQPDIILGDRDGTSCAPEFTDFVHRRFVAWGYRVAVNQAYKGAELVKAYSAPAAGRHSLQIEINRRLYMDEAAVRKTAGFATLQGDVTRLIGALADYASNRVK